MKQIGKIIETEKVPTTVDEFFFWTTKNRILNPFDVVKVKHIDNSIDYRYLNLNCRIILILNGLIKCFLYYQF